MSRKWIAGIVLCAAVTVLIGLAACSHTPAGTVYASAQPQTEDVTIAELRQTIAELSALINLLLGTDSTNEEGQQAGIPSISSQRAREIAVEAVGYGAARDVLLFSEDGVLQFEVDVRHLNRRYMVYIDAINGEFLSISRFDDVVLPGYVMGFEPGMGPGIPAVPPAVMPTPSPQASPSPSPRPQVSPSPSPRPQVSPSPSPSPGTGQTGRPVNPAITLERAIEIGYEELARRGHTGSFRNHSGMDLERGQWVWELLFNVQGGRLPFVEMYINVDTGAVVKFEWDD